MVSSGNISSYFSTIYTHTIPWALYTKVLAKANRGKSDQYLSNTLDQHWMGMQDGQTIGLPSGPDTSHIPALAFQLRP